MIRSSIPAFQRYDLGFTYIGLLILLAILGVSAAATVQVGALSQRRSAEHALLDIGAEYRRALRSYASSTPPGQARAPSSLNDLLRDPRFPDSRRHLRKIYGDPLTGKAEWGLLMSSDERSIVGIYSLAEGTTIKRRNFAEFPDFEGKKSYRDWVF